MSKLGLRDGRTATTSTELKGRESVGHEPEGRPERVSRMNQMKLTFPKYKRNEKEFFYKVATDETGNLDAYEADYYEFCVDENGQRVCVKDKGITHYLMQLPMKYRLEDMRLSDERVRGTIAAQQQLKDRGDYLPEGRKSVMTLDRDDPLDPNALT